VVAAKLPLPLVSSSSVAPLPRSDTAETVSGVLRHPMCVHTNCIVIAEWWPSWVNVCLHFPLSFVTVYGQHASPASCATFNSCSTLTWVPWRALLSTLSSDILLLLQGSQTFLDQLTHLYHTHPAVIVVVEDESDWAALFRAHGVSLLRFHSRLFYLPHSLLCVPCGCGIILVIQ
jgi:hypothetical protein